MNLSDTRDNPEVVATDEAAVRLSRSTSPVGDFLAVDIAGEPTVVLRLDDGTVAGEGHVAEVDPDRGLLELCNTNPGRARRTLISLWGDQDTGVDAGSVAGERLTPASPRTLTDRNGSTADVVNRVAATPTARFESTALWEDVTVECLEFRDASGGEVPGTRTTSREVERLVVSGAACVVDDPGQGTTVMESDRLVDVRFGDVSSTETGHSDGTDRRNGVDAGVSASSSAAEAGGVDQWP